MCVAASVCQLSSCVIAIVWDPYIAHCVSIIYLHWLHQCMYLTQARPTMSCIALVILYLDFRCVCDRSEGGTYQTSDVWSLYLYYVCMITSRHSQEAAAEVDAIGAAAEGGAIGEQLKRMLPHSLKDRSFPWARLGTTGAKISFRSQSCLPRLGHSGFIMDITRTCNTQIQTSVYRYCCGSHPVGGWRRMAAKWLFQGFILKYCQGGGGAKVRCERIWRAMYIWLVCCVHRLSRRVCPRKYLNFWTLWDHVWCIFMPSMSGPQYLCWYTPAWGKHETHNQIFNVNHSKWGGGGGQHSGKPPPWNPDHTLYIHQTI